MSLALAQPYAVRIVCRAHRAGSGLAWPRSSLAHKELKEDWLQCAVSCSWKWACLARVKCLECVVIVAQLVILVGVSLEMRSLAALLPSFLPFFQA